MSPCTTKDAKTQNMEILKMEQKVQNLWEDFLDAVASLEVMKNEPLENDCSHEEMKKKLGLENGTAIFSLSTKITPQS